MKRRIFAVALSAFAAFGLCACSDSKKPEPEQPKADLSVSEVRFDGEEGTLVLSDGKEIECGAQVEIPSEYMGHKIVGIDGGAFYGCDIIISLSIPESITSIGERAFAKCANLQTLKIASVESWCNISFEDSSANPMICATELYVGGEFTTDIVIPDTVTEIPDYAFYGGDFITSVSIPESITSIGERAFAKCANLQTLKIASVESWCNISFEDLSSNPMYFATELYVGDELATDIDIPDAVTEIPDYAFYECANITSVTVGEGVTSIGKNSFFNCEKLESVTLGGAVKEIGELAFANCFLLENLKLGESVETIGDYAFNKCYKLKEVTIPASVKKICESAFAECEGMTELTLNEGLEYIGDAAFCDCPSLEKFIMPDSVNYIGFGILMTIGGGAGFGGMAGGAGSADTVTVSDKITEIPDFTFSGCAMTSFTVGDRVTKINYSSFYGCDKLQNIVISKSVKEIVSYSFYKCPLLDTVYYKGTAAEWKNIKIGKNGNDIQNAVIYYYSEEQPQAQGSFWHYADGIPTKW